MTDNKKTLAWEIYEELKQNGAGIGNASVSIIKRVIESHEESEVQKTCGNCAWWNFKLGGLSSGKEWGECVNPKYYESMRLSDRLVDYGKVATIEDTAHYARISRRVKDYMRVQHEENTFGCIHFESAENEQ